jgi:hypothetical protein
MRADRVQRSCSILNTYIMISANVSLAVKILPVRLLVTVELLTPIDTVHWLC